MSVAEHAQVIGKTGTWGIEGLTVGVTILDVKQVYGSVRYAVSPINGNGVKWVDASRVKVDGQ